MGERPDIRLAFFRITDTEQQRLGQVIMDLMEGGEERAYH